MDVELQYFLVIMAGLISGIISEIGGAGSLVSLPILVSIGMPPVVANATNRMGVMALYTAAFVRYVSGHSIAWRVCFKAGVPLMIGTVVGAWFASSSVSLILDWAIVGTSVFVVVIDTYTPRLTKESQAELITHRSLWRQVWGYCILVAVGVYCGLVQSAMAYMMFSVLVTKLGVEVKMAESAKYFLSMIVTPVALVLFIIAGHVDYNVGLLLAGGAMIGGWIGGRMNQQYSGVSLKHIYFTTLVVSISMIAILMKHNIERGIFEI